MSLALNSRCRDTVCSVGIVPRTLPFIANNTSIRFFRQAVSLDDHRITLMTKHYNLQEDGSNEDGCDDGLTETNVKEVWFAGCHCGNLLLVLR
jgi:Uncharacterized alpha/beta hydrolase domain (DUF2235)